MLDGSLAHKEPLRDLSIGIVGRDHHDHIPFLRCEAMVLPGTPSSLDGHAREEPAPRPRRCRPSNGPPSSSGCSSLAPGAATSSAECPTPQAEEHPAYGLYRLTARRRG